MQYVLLNNFADLRSFVAFLFCLLLLCLLASRIFPASHDLAPHHTKLLSSRSPFIPTNVTAADDSCYIYICLFHLMAIHAFVARNRTKFPPSTDSSPSCTGTYLSPTEKHRYDNCDPCSKPSMLHRSAVMVASVQEHRSNGNSNNAQNGPTNLGGSHLIDNIGKKLRHSTTKSSSLLSPDANNVRSAKAAS
jgi:hypothetical protein